MSPLNKLIQGFREFKQREVIGHPEFRQLVAQGQTPKITLVACSDSRVDPALVFGCSPGDLFVIRNVANLVPPCEHDDALHGTSAALEYAVTQLEVEHIIVMGHAQCGGIASLVGMSSPRPLPAHSFIKSWMSAAEGALERARARNPDADQHALRRACEQESIRQSLDNLLTFPWIEERVRAGTLGIHGWYFDIIHEDLLALNPTSGRFEALD